jgi:hypothetical protein
MSEKYNGYANYQTWNVCLWISNDEMLYGLAQRCESYERFKIFLREVFEHHPVRFETPDGVAWNDSGIELAEVEKYWEESFSTVEA